MHDLISRKAAIDAVEKNACNTQRIMDAVNNLPPAQPDTTTHDSIPAETGGNYGDRTSGDCISRQQAIEAVVGCTNCGTEDVLRAYVTKHSLENVWTGGIVDALDAIEQLPSAHPDLDEWCTDCKEYDSDKHCCPRFSRVIREALKEAQPETAKRIVGKSRDGMTLWYQCDMCNEPVDAQDNYCRGCGRRLIDG